MKKTKVALLQSVIALLLCCAMLIGTTFAWFTDSVESRRNQIISGSLDVELEYLDKNEEWRPVKADTNVFAEDTLWEPGHAEVVYLRISNQGNLALKYRLGVNVASETPSINVNGEPLILSKHIQFGVQNDRNGKTDPWTSRSQAIASVSGTAKVLNAGYNASGVLYAEDDCPTDGRFQQYVAMVVYMPESVGNEANYRAGENVPEIMLGLSLVASQQTLESDNFGSNYDEQSTFPALKPGSVSEEFSVNNNLTAEAKTMRGEGISAEVPAGVKVDKNLLTLSVSEMTGTNSNITLGSNEQLRALDVHMDGVSADNTIPMKITVEKAMMKGLNIGNFTLYHVENGVSVPMTAVDSVAKLDVHNEFYYDPATGDVTLCMATFSEVALVADTENAWNGEIDISWYTNAVASIEGESVTEYIIANADQLAGLNKIVSGADGYTQDSFEGKTVKLVANINIGDNESIVWYPIGYWKEGGTVATVDIDDAPEFVYTPERQGEETFDGGYSKRFPVNAVAEGGATNWYTYGGSFKGTFDGSGHKISNIYQNTWQLKGNYDGHYWNAAMGLFGYVYGGTIKNLTVHNFSSDGEFTPTGVIAAYAAGDATFENIAITNCNPRVYNTGNGGIIGIAGNTSEANDDHITLKNITVDNSNKISALWGSWDVACGGLVGMYRGNVDGSGNATGDTISFENCHVAAQIDVYNDVCANYQYYAYRYSGMIIGSVRHNTNNAEGRTIPNMTGISASDCTVHFGTWNDYYYCELVDNTTASYTHDFQMSRLVEIKAIDGTTITYLDDTTGTVPASGRANYVIVDYSKGHGTGNASCYHFKNGEVWSHEDGGKETVNGVEVLKEDKQHLYLEFNNLFTGYGWGVSSMGIDKWNGIEKLDVTTGDHEKSVEKFEGKVNELVNNKTYKLGDIFTLIEKCDVDLVPGALTVSVTNKAENNPVSATIVYDRENWENGTITLTGTGEITITIQDYYFCTPTTITVDVSERQPEEKFDIVMNNGDFLHRVGNVGTVALDKLFKAKDGVTVGTVSVTVEAVNGTGASGTYSNNAIQFSGTGVVKLTIQDDNFCTPTVLYLEVVDATNITSATGTTTGGTFVLLNDVNTSTYVNYWNCTLYGNGFTYSLKGAPTAYNSKQGHGIIITKNATLDNLVIVGDVYNSYGAYTNQDYYNTAIDVVGDTTIQNCYIANCAAPVKARSNVTIKNTTLYGGTVANLLIMSGTATLENVTTANYDDGRAMVGMGVVIHPDATETAKLVLNGTLTQYNFVSESKVPTDTYAKNLHDAMFSSDCSQYQFGSNPNRYVNTGIISLTSTFNGEDITDNAKTGYVGKSLRVASYDGYVYTQLNTSGSVNNNCPEYKPTTQGAVPPSYSFDYTNKNYIAKTDGSNDYCYEENGKVNISMDEGDTFNWDTSILTIGKGITSYTVSMNGTDYTGKKIVFKAAGDYTVTYTYTDDNNYKLDENGNITTYSATYTKAVNITVAVVKATTKHAEFTFGSSNTASTTVTVGNNTYVMPNVSGTSSTIGSTTVSGQTIYYPIVEIIMSDGKTSHTSGWYAYFPVFSGAVTITDYANNGTGDKMTPYNGSTTTMPDGLSIVGDPTQLFKYQSSSAAGSTPVVKNNKLVYSSAKIEAKRSEYNTVIQYSYTDNAGATYYYYIGYHAPAQSYSSVCLTPDTLITLADGTQKEIQHLRVGEEVLAWNFYTGRYEVVPVSLLQTHGTGIQNVLHLYFEDGTELKILGEHGVFDADLNTFVFIDEDDVVNYVGHSFVKQDGEGFTTVKLVDFEVTTENTTAYTILSFDHYNVMAEGMFTVTPAHVGDNFFNPFDVGEDMKYDEDAVKVDLAKYGMYTYEDFDHVLTYDQFVALNLGHFKVSVGKGYITYDGLIFLIKNFINNEDFNVNN